MGDQVHNSTEKTKEDSHFVAVLLVKVTNSPYVLLTDKRFKIKKGRSWRDVSTERPSSNVDPGYQVDDSKSNVQLSHEHGIVPVGCGDVTRLGEIHIVLISGVKVTNSPSLILSHSQSLHDIGLDQENSRIKKMTTNSLELFKSRLLREHSLLVKVTNSLDLERELDTSPNLSEHWPDSILISLSREIPLRTCQSIGLTLFSFLSREKCGQSIVMTAPNRAEFPAR
eukprot:sb/3469617/